MQNPFTERDFLDLINPDVYFNVESAQEVATALGFVFLPYSGQDDSTLQEVRVLCGAPGAVNIDPKFGDFIANRNGDDDVVVMPLYFDKYVVVGRYFFQIGKLIDFRMFERNLDSLESRNAHYGRRYGAKSADALRATIWFYATIAALAHDRRFGTEYGEQCMRCISYEARTGGAAMVVALCETLRPKKFTILKVLGMKSDTFLDAVSAMSMAILDSVLT